MRGHAVQFTLTVDEKHLAVIEAGLNELPRKHAQPVIEVLFTQVMAQRRAVAEKAEAARATPAVTNGSNGTAPEPPAEPAQV